MLIKINSIKDFGIFSNFSWHADTNTFKQRNLIYGWNYSGKTTFSKLFSNLERKGKVHFPSSEYTFEIEAANQTFNHDGLDAFPYPVKVFNSHYIRHVFSWDVDGDSGFAPIMFYLGDVAGDIQPKINAIRERWNPKIENIRDTKKTLTDAFEEFAKDNGKFSKQATSIRRFLNDQVKVSDFNKGHMVNFIVEFGDKIGDYIIAAEEIDSTKQKSIALNEYSIENAKLSVQEEIGSIITNVKALLEDTAPKSLPFPEIENDQNVFKWVQSGLSLHTSSDDCKFCGNPISESRISDLNTFYSTKLTEIQATIKKIRTDIATELRNLNTDFVHESKIASHLRQSYIDSVKNFKKKVGEYTVVLDILEADLKRKENNYFVSITASHAASISTSTELRAITDIITTHNLFVDNFGAEKKKALAKILRHYTAEYLIAEDYVTKKEEYNKATDLVARCNQKIKNNNAKITAYSALLKDTLKGQGELNIYLKIFLNREDISIDIKDNKYVLKRGIYEATNLSEGEKTAIAFSYFLTELKSLKQENTLKDTIVFFDDPISSLDSNHIFQVRSLIQHFFSDKSDYLQLFISTHNFEFFSVLLDSSLFKNENKDNISVTKCPYYLINRIAGDSSVIKNLPKSLRSHKSEYAHIFNILKDYNESAAKDSFEFIILLPNALRRFLELYSLFKFPKGFSEVDERLKMIFSPDGIAYHNTKLYHWFSHENQFEKILSHDAKIILIDEAISEIMLYIKTKDPMHWRGLTGEVPA